MEGAGVRSKVWKDLPPYGLSKADLQTSVLLL